MKRCSLAVLLLTVGCSSGQKILPPEECGPQLAAVDFDDDWLPGAPGLDPDSASVPVDVDGLDAGHGGVSYAVLLAGHYHLRIQRPVDCEEDGYPCQPFGYQYDPLDDRWEEDESVGRQIVAVLAQTRQYALLRRPELKVSARDGLLLMERNTSWNDTGARLYGGLGPTILAAAATAEYQRVTGDLQFSELVDGLGSTMLANVADDGTWPNGTALQFAQAQQALWRLYATTGEAQYLDALRLMARYASENTDQNAEGEFFEFPYIYGLWAAEAVTELYRIDGEQWMADLIYKVGDDVITRQYRHAAPGVVTNECAWRGGWTPNDGDGPPNWNSTIKLEAMVDSWRMASVSGDAAREAAYRSSAEAGVAWMLTNQYRAGDTLGFADPEKPIGGFPLFADDPDVRIDIPGHGSIALAKAAAWLVEEQTPGEFGVD